LAKGGNTAIPFQCAVSSQLFEWEKAAHRPKAAYLVQVINKAQVSKCPPAPYRKAS